DGVTRVSSCAQTHYTITVTNLGSDPVTGAVVRDRLSVPLSGVTWSCGAPPGSHCTEAGSGSGGPIDVHVDLQPQASVIYTVTASVSATASGVLVNRASVQGPDGVIHNDSDSDAIDPPNADLA